MINLEKLKELGLDSISFRVSGDRGELRYIDEEIDKWIEEQEISDKYMINIFIEILGTNLDTNESVEIGKLTGNFFESEIVIDDTDFYDVCDSIDTDLEHMAAAIVDKDGNIRAEICEFDDNLMYIDRLFIEEKYRGLGIASYVLKYLKNILEYSVNLNPTVLIILPVPQEIDNKGLLSQVENDEDRIKYEKKLIKLYKKLGFTKIKNSNYMIKITRGKYI